MPATTIEAAQPTFQDEKTYLIARIAGDLAPTLADKPQDRRAAMQMAWRMVKSYHPASEAEVIAGARIASMSMLQLDLTREATQPDLTPALKLQYTRAVISLSRAITQAETALARRQLAEERRSLGQQPVEPERINRTSNQKAVDEAAIDRILEEIDLINGTAQREEAATPPPDPEAPSPEAADPVAPPVPRAAPAKPAQPAGSGEYARAVAAAHAQYHAILSAAAQPLGPRPQGAGSPPPGSLAAGPG